MTVTAQLIVLIALAYLAGSIPFGLLVGKARGIDVRKSGSGNIGASNVGRLLGRRFFFLVFFFDLLKSLIPLLVADWLVGGQPQSPGWVVNLLWLLVGFAAVFGHMFSIFLMFKGGKGVATSAGLMLGLYPYYTWPALVAIGVWMLLFFTTRYISVASMGGAILFPIAYALFGWQRGWLTAAQWPMLTFAILIAVLVVWKHRSNIARLRAGTENRAVKRVDNATA